MKQFRCRELRQLFTSFSPGIIPWAKEPGRLQSVGSQRSTERLNNNNNNTNNEGSLGDYLSKSCEQVINHK